MQDIEAGYIKGLVLIEPDGPTWPLPLCELALMTAERVQHERDMRDRVHHPHERPLQAFGGSAAEAVERLFEEGGITLHAGATARVESARHVVVEPQGSDLRPERVVTLPRITGPDVGGISGVAPYRLLPIDGLCRIRELDGRVFAAGDATDFAVKHGGISAQQADTAAAGIAHLAGACEAPAPFEPVLHGMLLTGHKPLFIAAHVVAGKGWHCEVYDEPPWPSDEKVVAEELGRFLREQDEPPRALTAARASIIASTPHGAPSPNSSAPAACTCCHALPGPNRHHGHLHVLIAPLAATAVRLLVLTRSH